MDLKLTTASGAVLDLDFEPVQSLAADPKNFIETILREINCGHNGCQSIYHECLRRGDVVVDLGANVGLVSLYASTVASRVVAVEASPRHFATLYEVLRKTGATNVTPLHAAVWTRDGELTFAPDADNSTMDRIDYPAECDGVPRPQGVRVPCLTLAAILDQFRIDRAGWVKMDVEGAELDILESPSFARAAHRIDRLWVEVHNYKDGRDGVLLAHQVREELLKHFPRIHGFTNRWMLALRE